MSTRQTHRFFLLFTIAAALAVQSAAVQEATAPAKKRLTRAMVEGRRGGLDIDGSWATGLRWLDDQHYREMRDGKAMRVNAESGDATPIVEDDALPAGLRESGRFDEETLKRLGRNPGRWSRDRSTLHIRLEEKNYIYTAKNASVRPLPDLKDVRELDISPAGGFLSYVDASNNLHLVDTRTGAARALSRDGSSSLFYGILDWVYQEEIYGRGNWRAYWWSDDDRYLAYFRLDESKVPVYRIINQTELRAEPEETHYPKAGEPNPTVRLAISRAGDGRTTWVDLRMYEGIEFLIVQVNWSPDGKLIYSVQDREQTWMDVNEADPETGASRTLIHEASPAFVENFGKPFWLGQGESRGRAGFLWLSERDGFAHIYFYGRDGGLLSRVTGGDWTVSDIVGCDEKSGYVYFTAERDSAFRSDAYRVKITGGAVERLTAAGAHHDANFSPGFAYFFDTFSNAVTPPRVHLRRGDGSLVRVISANATDELSKYEVALPEYVRVPARDGWLLNASVVRPPDFDPTKKYAVYCPIYAGPYAPTVHDRWRGRSLLEDALMAQEGVIVWRCDPRSAGADSRLAAWQCHKRMGQSELRDLEDGLKWLIAQGGVDTERVCIEGHSYGGYMTCYALTHSKLWTCGIAGAPVTDWRHYDTIYTERYMLTPENNTAGYDAGSVITAAENLHGRLLLAHGMMDDNVHFPNSAQFVRALHQARKQFDFMVFPRDRHGFGEGGRFWRDMRNDFLDRHLRPAKEDSTAE